MEARVTEPAPATDPGRRVGYFNLVWLLSPLAYPALFSLPQLIPEGIRVLAGVALIFVVPGWLLHVLVFPMARIELSLRITRAFALSTALIALLGLVIWFCGGDWRLGEVSLADAIPPRAGRLTTAIWTEAFLLLVGAVLLAIRSYRRLAAAPGARNAAPAVGAAEGRSEGVSPPGPADAERPTAAGEQPKKGPAKGRRGAAERPGSALSPSSLTETSNPVMQRILREAYRLGDQHKADHPVAPRWATLVVLGVMVLLASCLGFQSGGQLGFVSDAPDHIACIREMVEQDRVLPRTTFYVDGDGAAVDARKGFFHVALAVLAVLAHVDPARMWDLIPGMFIPLALIVFHTFARRLLRSEGTALFATFLALICYGEVTRGMFSRLAYGSYMGIVLSWATLAMGLEYVLKSTPRRTLVLLIAGGFAATATHAFSPALILFALGAYLVAMLLMRGVHHPPLKRLGLAILFVLVGCALPLAWRLLFTQGPTNPIHTHRQGILFFGSSFFINTPFEWGRLLTITGFGGILLSLFLWQRAREDDAVLYMVALSIAPLLVVANPVIVPLLEPFLGYLVARFVVVTPFLMVLAYMARRMGENFLELHSARRVVAALFFYVFMVALLFPRLESFARSHSAATKEKLRARSVLVWEDLMKRLDSEIQAPKVILSDPLTSYAIPALSRHYVVSVLHQHGSPSDTLALVRLAACRDVLSPYLGAGEKARLCRRFGVDCVLVNCHHQRPRHYFACSVGPELARAQKEALDAEPALFRKVWNLGADGALYRVRRENLDALAGIVIPGHSRPAARTTEELIQGILVHELPVNAIPAMTDTVAGITLAGVAMDSTLASPGDRVGMTLYWRRTGDPPRFPLQVHVRLDTAAPRGPLWTLHLSKVHRLIQQKRLGLRYRNRQVHVPLQGMLSVQRWPTDRYVVDRTVVSLPANAAVGDYQVKVMWEEQTFLPNHHISHFLSDRDAYDGQTVALLEVY